MDINKLDVFLRAADNGSFIKTAQELMYTQSGITHMMNALEKDLGFPLFTRTNKGVTLTAEGKRILPLVRELSHAHETLQQECSLINHVSSGNLRIASFSSIAIQWLPPIMERLKQDHPRLHVEILEDGDAARMEEWLSSGFVDMCFFTLEDRYSFDTIELAEDPMLLIMPKGHPLAELDAVPLSALEKEPFLVASTASGLDKDVMHILGAAPFTPKITHTSNLDYSIISMVSHNLGISIMPAMMIHNWLDLVEARPFDPPIYRRVGIGVRSMKGLSPAAKKFISYTKGTLRLLEPDRIKF